MKHSMVTCEVLTNVMKNQGVDIGIVYYQEMGNWSELKPEGVRMHLHIFCRAKTATKQKYGDAVSLPHKESGFYDDFKILNENDIKEMHAEIERLLKTENYKNFMSMF